MRPLPFASAVASGSGVGWLYAHCVITRREEMLGMTSAERVMHKEPVSAAQHSRQSLVQLAISAPIHY